MKNKKEKINKKNSKNTYYSFSFLILVITLYVVLFFLKSDKIKTSLDASWNIFVSIIPVLILVVFIMGVSNYFLRPKKVSKYFGKE